MIVGTVRNGVGVGARSNAATVGIAVGSSGVETVSGVLGGRFCTGAGDQEHHDHHQGVP